MGRLRFVPLLMSSGLLHTAPQRKRKKEINGEKKKRKKGLFYFSQLLIRVFWWIFGRYLLTEKVVYIFELSSPVCRGECAITPRPLQVQFINACGKKSLKRNHVLLANKRECTY